MLIEDALIIFNLFNLYLWLAIAAVLWGGMGRLKKYVCAALIELVILSAGAMLIFSVSLRINHMFEGLYQLVYTVRVLYISFQLESYLLADEGLQSI